MECLQEASGLIFIRLRKCEKDFGEEHGGRESSQEEKGSIMNVKIRERHHLLVDILSGGEGWCYWRS